jgi:hypothetical protein
MNQLNEQQLRQHVTILGWILLLEHVVLLFVGLFVWIVLTGIAAVTRDPEAVAILGIVAIAVALLLAALSVPGLVAGWALLARKSWARYLALAVAVLGLVNVPLGTLIGIYAIWVLLQDTAASYFSGNQRQPAGAMSG